MWRGAGERRWDLSWLAFPQRRARAGERRWAVRVCLSLAAPRPHRIAIRPPATPRRFSFGTRALAHLVGHNLTSGPLYNPCRLQRMTCWASKRRIDRNPNLLSIYIYRVIDTTLRIPSPSFGAAPPVHVSFRFRLLFYSCSTSTPLLFCCARASLLDLSL